MSPALKIFQDALVKLQRGKIELVDLKKSLQAQYNKIGDQQMALVLDAQGSYTLILALKLENGKIAVEATDARNRKTPAFLSPEQLATACHQVLVKTQTIEGSKDLVNMCAKAVKEDYPDLYLSMKLAMDNQEYMIQVMFAPDVRNMVARQVASGGQLGGVRQSGMFDPTNN